MTGRARHPVDDHDIDIMIGMYRQLGAQIAQHREDIKGLEHKQALVIEAMRAAGLTYRQIAPLVGRSSSRVHQLAETLRP